MFTFPCNVRGVVQAAHEGLQSKPGINTLSIQAALVEPHRLPVPVTSCHESPEDVESFRCRIRRVLCGIGTPIGDVRFVDKDKRENP